MAMIYKPSVNPAALIEEVRKRPCLYDNRSGHGNHMLKNAAWGEIGGALFDDKWQEYSPAEKDLRVKDMQVKWKSIRDNFARQLRFQDQVKSVPNYSNPTKKYMFMDQLSFLQPYIHKRENRIAFSEDSKDSAGTDSEGSLGVSESKPLTSSGDFLEVSSASPSQMQFVSIQPKPFVAGTLTPVDLNSGLSFGEEPPMKKVAKCLEELVSFQKEQKDDDPMGNRKFLLSLLPFMKKLPDDVNLEVRLQLMSVLETYTSSKNVLTAP
ncbi:uncharacterized protein [Euwallacea similis]|uniref:uncharacterized protein n=1 Tax=Euwallacea similis TaxID=1736056 RepID=UPI003450AA8B